MDHLYLMLTELYPDRDFKVQEFYERVKKSKNFAKIHKFELYIEDRVSEVFKNFDDLEEFIFELYKKECVIQAEEILKNQEEKQ